jgi:hypothetical protein
MSKPRPSFRNSNLRLLDLPIEILAMVCDCVIEEGLKERNFEYWSRQKHRSIVPCAHERLHALVGTCRLIRDVLRGVYYGKRIVILDRELAEGLRLDGIRRSIRNRSMPVPWISALGKETRSQFRHIDVVLGDWKYITDSNRSSVREMFLFESSSGSKKIKSLLSVERTAKWCPTSMRGFDPLLIPCSNIKRHSVRRICRRASNRWN